MARKKKCKPPRVYVERVRINRQGYDAQGRYWGVGEPLYRIDTVEGSFSEHIRAKDQKAARAQAKVRVQQKFCGTGGPFFGLPGGGAGLGAIPAPGLGGAGRVRVIPSAFYATKKPGTRGFVVGSRPRAPWVSGAPRVHNAKIVYAQSAAQAIANYKNEEDGSAFDPLAMTLDEAYDAGFDLTPKPGRGEHADDLPTAEDVAFSDFENPYAEWQRRQKRG